MNAGKEQEERSDANLQESSAKEIIYNVTVKVERSIARQWLQWQIEEHGPQLLATGCFTAFHVLQLLEVDDTEGPTYVVQYKAGSMENYMRYMDEHSTVFRKKSFDKWGNGFIAFRTVMQVVS